MCVVLHNCDDIFAVSRINIGSMATPLRSRLIRAKYLTARTRSDNVQYNVSRSFRTVQAHQSRACVVTGVSLLAFTENGFIKFEWKRICLCRAKS